MLYKSRDANTPYNATTTEVIAAISDLRDKADGSGNDDEGIVKSDANGDESNLVPANSEALAFTRTPIQVWQILGPATARRIHGSIHQ